MSTRSTEQRWCSLCEEYAVEVGEIWVDATVVPIYRELCVVCRDKIRTGELVLDVQ